MEPSSITFASWLVAFLLTLVIELPVVAWLARPLEPRLGRRLGAALLASSITHPAVWFVFPALPWPWAAVIAAAEAWAWLAEAGVYRMTLRHASWRASLLVSFAANAASFAAGLLLSATGAIA